MIYRYQIDNFYFYIWFTRYVGFIFDWYCYAIFYPYRRKEYDVMMEDFGFILLELVELREVVGLIECWCG
jgi:hypothetical protein